MKSIDRQRTYSPNKYSDKPTISANYNNYNNYLSNDKSDTSSIATFINKINDIDDPQSPRNNPFNKKSIIGAKNYT